MESLKSRIKSDKAHINQISRNSAMLGDVISGETTLEDTVSDLIKDYFQLAKITGRVRWFGIQRISPKEKERIEEFNEKIFDLNGILSGFDTSLSMPDLFTYGEMKNNFDEAFRVYQGGYWATDWDGINRYGKWLKDVEETAGLIREKAVETDEIIHRLYAVDYFSSRPELFREVYQQMDDDYRGYVESELKLQIDLGMHNISQLELKQYLQNLEREEDKI